MVAAVDLSGRFDDDPVNAPAPDDPRDPRSSRPYPLPHNSGEHWNGAAKLVVPLSARVALRAAGIHSETQQLLYDPAYKYDPDFAPGERVRGDLLSGQLEYRTDPNSGASLVIDLRAARFVREFLRGALDAPVDYAVGALTGSRFHFIGEDIARAQTPSLEPIPGLAQPEASTATPWGVPAFFLSGASSGDLAWNHYGESRLQLDLIYGGIHRLDLYAGGQFSAQQVRTYQRALGYLPVGDEVPPAAISAFSPRAAAAYVEGQVRVADVAVTAGLRDDQFAAGSDLPGETRGAQRAVSPRLAVSTVLHGATVVVSYGRFTQAPDYQFLVDAAFDDTTRTGRFRRGNPDLGFERASQYEMSVRVRPREAIAVRAGIYVKRLTGLVASVPLGIDPDSTVFGNADAGTVKGLELLLERELRNGVGVRVAYTLQRAEATATDPFLLDRLTVVDPLTGDTTRPARAEFPLDFDRRQTLTVILRGKAPGTAGPRLLGVRPLGGWEGALILRALSGLPYSRSDSTGDTLLGLPNDSRLPWSSSLDLLVRRPVRLGRLNGGVYLDVRNLLNQRNIVAVRRDTGEPQAEDATITRLAESARYRAYADLDHNGLLEGQAELLPLYLAAARLLPADLRLRAAQAGPARPRAALLRYGSGEVLPEQRLIQGHARFRAFGCGHDHELRFPRGVTADVETRHVGGLRLPGVDRAPLGERTAQAAGKVGALVVPRRQEQRPAGHAAPVGEHHPLELAVGAVEPEHPLLPQQHADGVEPFAHVLGQLSRTIGAKHQIVGPDREGQREAGPGLSPAIHGNRLIPPLPGVAVGAMMHAQAVQGCEALDLRELVDHAGGQQQLPALKQRPVRAAYGEPVGSGGGVHHARMAQLDTLVLSELVTGEPEELGGWSTVPTEEPVDLAGPPVARRAEVADQHAPAAAAEHERGAQARGAAAHHDAVPGRAVRQVRPHRPPSPA